MQSFALLLLLQISYALATVQPIAYILELTNIHSFLTEYPEIHVRHTFNSSILTGVSVNFHSLDDAHRALQDPNVVQTWPVTLHARPMSSYSIKETPDAAHKLTSQNLAYQQLRTDGSGIRIGVIDSGVDYRHPALGGCFGANCKVRYGYDLVGDDYNGDFATLKPDPDPMDSCDTGSDATGHGTHISGILAADDKELNWTGVAPGATLGMWRVFSCQNVLTPNDILIKAMEMAYKADMDIVNLSFGENGGWAEDPLSVVADRMVEAGVHVVVASGDSGGNGVFLTAAPATGRNVISTGSIDNRLVAAHVLDIQGLQQGSIVYRTADNFPIYNQTHHPLVSVSKSHNRSGNACASLPHNLTNAYVVTNRGDCSDYTQATNLQQAGAAAVILVSLPDQDTNIGLISVGIPVVSVPFDNGQQIQHLLRKKNRLSAQLTTILSTLPVLSGGQVSSLSTLGPTNELELKPELSAVGGYVFSTLPRYLGSYGTMSGTSMSSPWVAGSIALLLDYNKELTPQQVRTALMNYAQPVNTTITNKPMIDSPIRQGAGVADIISTIACVKTLSVNPPKLNLNDTQHFTNTHSLTITNHQDSELTVYISCQNSATVAGYNISNAMDFEPLEPVSFLAMSRSSDYAHIGIASSKMVLLPGQNATISLDITPPTTNNRFHSFYGGYIVVRTSGCTASVPFIGMSGNMSELPILDRSTSFPFPSIGNPNNTILSSNETGQYVLNQTFPSVLARLLTGTAIAQIQVLDQHHHTLGDVPLQITTNQTSPNPRAWVVRNLQKTVNGATDFKVWKWDFTYLPVNATMYGQNQQLNKMQTVTPGTYRLKLRTLKVFGNRNNIHDWEQWTSPPLQVKSMPVKHHSHTD